MTYRYDYLVIGSGIAGMSFALKVAREGAKVALVCKTTLAEANTALAQGGIASVTNLLVDDFDKHIHDTMVAGDWLSAPEAVEMVVKGAPEQIRQLIGWGVDFDKTPDGDFDLHKEGGHSEFRILHHADNTGFEIQESLIEAVRRNPHIDIFEGHFAIEIITQHHLGRIVTRRTPDICCYGAYVLDLAEGRVDTFLSKITVMATGGCGAVYQTTTNLYGDDHVYLDVTHKDAEETKRHFPNIYKKCLSLGIDITKDYIPVAPAAHYLCGGIKVDTNGESSIHHLYALGECSCTGLHGGNRLASNSLIEAVVYADAAAKHASAELPHVSLRDDVPAWNDEGTRHNEEMVLITQSIREVGQIMGTYVGIVRSDLRLDRAWNRLDILYEETERLFKCSKASREICELRNIINVGYLIMRQAKERRESRGLHYTIDYPPVPHNPQ